MALWLAAQIAGEEVAHAIQLAIEYDPQPPFDSGSPPRPTPIVDRQFGAQPLLRRLGSRGTRSRCLLEELGGCLGVPRSRVRPRSSRVLGVFVVVALFAVLGAAAGPAAHAGAQPRRPPRGRGAFSRVHAPDAGVHPRHPAAARSAGVAQRRVDPSPSHGPWRRTGIGRAGGGADRNGHQSHRVELPHDPPRRAARPSISNLNFASGQTVANLSEPARSTPRWPSHGVQLPGHGSTSSLMLWASTPPTPDRSGVASTRSPHAACSTPARPRHLDRISGIDAHAYGRRAVRSPRKRRHRRRPERHDHQLMAPAPSPRCPEPLDDGARRPT